MTLTGTRKELLELLNMYMVINHKLYTPILAEGIVGDLWDGDNNSVCTITFAWWSPPPIRLGILSQLVTLDELKQRFPQWKDEIEISFLENLL